MIKNGKQYFSKDDTTLFKRIGILLIIIHNYLHWQPDFNIENEDKYTQKNILVFIENLYPVNWTDSFSAIFGYLGRYGVQLFIFFSTYGLTIQMVNSKSEFNSRTYIFKWLKKLYFLLIFAIVLFVVFYFFHNGTLFIAKKFNIYQLYIGVFSIVYLLYYINLNTIFSLFGTIFGHLPEIILGIYFALKGITKPALPIVGISIIIFVLSQYFWFVFPFSFVGVTLIMIYILQSTKTYLNPFFKTTLLYIGEISMILFIVNGFLRLNPLFKISDSALRGERIFLYIVLLFTICYFVNKLYISLTKILKI